MSEDNVVSLPQRDQGNHPSLRRTPPSFQGKDVDGSRVRIGSTAGLDFNFMLRVDELVTLTVTGYVVGVSHAVNAKGALERIHHIKPTEVGIE